MTDIQKVVLELLIEIDRICRKNKIEYALGYGSALGIVNFQGFIPWDEDADIIMTKDNWDKFVSACKIDLNQNKYVLDCFENNSKYDIFIPAKLRYKDSRVVEKFDSEYFTSHTENRGIFVDIQIIIPVENELNYLNLMRKFCKKSILNIPTNFLTKEKYKNKLKLFELNYIENNKNYNQKYRQTFLSGGQYFVEKKRNSHFYSTLFPVKECEFESHKFYSVNNIKQYCIDLYGEKCFNYLEYSDKLKKSKFKKYKIYDKERGKNINH